MGVVLTNLISKMGGAKLSIFHKKPAARFKMRQAGSCVCVIN